MRTTQRGSQAIRSRWHGSGLGGNRGESPAGARDRVVPPPNLRRIAARAPAGRLRVFAGAHAFLFQQRRPFVKVLEHFLRG